MKLELHSHKNDILELELAECVRPEIRICEILTDKGLEPWHATWKTLEIKKFTDDFDVVKTKIVDYYKAEWKSSQVDDGVCQRKPGFARLVSPEEEWTLFNCKVSEYSENSDKKELGFELFFDSVQYKNNSRDIIRCDGSVSGTIC
jgi:hypothetical protein